MPRYEMKIALRSHTSLFSNLLIVFLIFHIGKMGNAFIRLKIPQILGFRFIFKQIMLQRPEQKKIQTRRARKCSNRVKNPMTAGIQEGTTHLLYGNPGPGCLSRERKEQLQPKTQSGRQGNRYSDTFCGLNILSELRYFHKQFQHCAGLYIQSNGYIAKQRDCV